jgi:GNAT superfamily N-acetyltransferase
MPIRFATLEDLPQLLALGQRMHALTRFKAHPFEREKLAQQLQQIITQGQSQGKYAFLVAANSKAQVAGILIGVMEQHIFSPGWCASVMHYDVLPEARGGGYAVRLLKAFEQWAKNRKAMEINLGVNSGGDFARVGKFAQRMGYSKIGENYALQV